MLRHLLSQTTRCHAADLLIIYADLIRYAGAQLIRFSTFDAMALAPCFRHY